MSDLIERQAVIDATCKICGNPYCHRKCGKIAAIEEIPSAEQRTAKTVIYYGDGYADGEALYDEAECPTCGYHYEDGDKDWGEPYCPHCGQALKWESENE